MKKMLLVLLMLAMALCAAGAMAAEIGSCDGGCKGHTVTENGVIAVTGGMHYITLKDVNINANGSNLADQAAFSIARNAKVFLTLEGQNVLTSKGAFAGLNVPDGAELEITAQSTGSLTATGGQSGSGMGGAGIGGNQGEKGGVITIHGGTVSATGIGGGAGIGGGGDGAGGTVTITGGTVTARGTGGAGIGGGEDGGGGDVVITGGTVEADSVSTGSKNGMAIGAGGGVAIVGTLTVSGDVIEMRGGAGKESAQPLEDAQEFLKLSIKYAFIRVLKAAQTGTVVLPKTGDPSMLGAWIALLGASGLGMRLRRKK